MRLGPIIFQPGGRVRPGWRILLYILLAALAAQLAVWVYYAAGSLPLPATILRGESGNLILLDLLLCLAALGSAFVLIRHVDRRRFAALGFALQRRTVVEVLQGIAFGSAMVTAIFAVQAAAGWGDFTWSGADARTAASGGAAAIVSFTLAAALEELVARGYIFQALIEGTGSVTAIAITSVLFGLGHVMNPHATALGMVNTVLAGVWLAVGYLKTRSLWLSTGMHLSWNFCLGYVFGFPVSGLRISGSLLQAEPSGPGWVTGGAYGPEGGVLCGAVLALGTLLLARSRRIRPSPDAPTLWDRQVNH